MLVKEDISILKPKSEKERQKIMSEENPQKLLSDGIKNNNLELVKHAIEERGAVQTSEPWPKNTPNDPYAPYNDWPLQWAIRRGNIEIVKYLLSKHPKEEGEYFSPEVLWQACGQTQFKKNSSPEIVKILLKDKRINPYADSNGSFLSEAIQYLNFDVIDLIIKDGRVNPLGAGWRSIGRVDLKEGKLLPLEGQRSFNPDIVYYYGNSPLGQLQWSFSQHKRSLTVPKFAKYRLTKDQLKKLKQLQEDLIKIAQNNKKKGYNFRERIFLIPSEKGHTTKIDPYGRYGRMNESIFKPKTEEEIKQSLTAYPATELIQLGFNKNLEEPILWAIEREKFDDRVYKKIFLWGINHNKSRVIEKLLNLYTFKESVLQQSMEKTDYDTTKVILDYGIKPTNDLLNKAIINNESKKVQLFLNYEEVDPTLDGNIALSFALHNWADFKDLKILKLIINDSRVRATLDPRTLETLDKNYNVPVIENLVYINKINTRL